MPAAQQRGQRSSDRASSRTLEAFWLANEVYPFVPGVESLFSAAVVGGVSQHNAAELLETGHVLRDHVPAKSVAFFSILCMYWRFRALHDQPPPSPGAQERRARRSRRRVQRSLTGESTGGGPRRQRKFWFFYTYGTVGERPLGILLQSLRTTAVTFTSDFPQYLGRAQW